MTRGPKVPPLKQWPPPPQPQSTQTPKSRTARTARSKPPATSSPRKPPAQQPPPPSVRRGDRVRVTLEGKESTLGVVKYIGMLEHRRGYWIGVHLFADGLEGCDGTCPAPTASGTGFPKRYFYSTEGHGFFVRPSAVEVIKFSPEGSPKPKGKQEHTAPEQPPQDVHARLAQVESELVEERVSKAELQQKVDEGGKVADLEEQLKEVTAALEKERMRGEGARAGAAGGASMGAKLAIEAAAQLSSGLSVIAYGRTGKPFPRHIWLNASGTALVWDEEKQFDEGKLDEGKRMELEEIKGIQCWETSPVFRLWQPERDVYPRSFSLVSEKRTLDVSAKTEKEKEHCVAWLRAVLAIVNPAAATARMGSPKEKEAAEAVAALQTSTLLKAFGEKKGETYDREVFLTHRGNAIAWCKPGERPDDEAAIGDSQIAIADIELLQEWHVQPFPRPGWKKPPSTDLHPRIFTIVAKGRDLDLLLPSVGHEFLSHLRVFLGQANPAAAAAVPKAKK